MRIKCKRLKKWMVNFRLAKTEFQSKRFEVNTLSRVDSNTAQSEKT